MVHRRVPSKAAVTASGRASPDYAGCTQRATFASRTHIILTVTILCLFDADVSTSQRGGWQTALVRLCVGLH